MAQYCLEEGSEFGVVLIREGPEIGDKVAKTYAVGTTAEIADFRDAGDHILVLAIGRKRFRIVQVFDDGPYPEAEVELLSEQKGAGVSPEVVADIRSLFADEVDLILQLLGFEGVELEIPAQADKLSYMIAAHLRIPLQAKQELLETDRCGERLARELELVQKERQEYRLLLAAREHFDWDTAGDGLEQIFSDN